MNVKSLTAPMMIAMTAMTVACGESASAPDEETQFFEIVHERTTGPGEVDPQAVEALNAGNIDAAFRLHRKMRKDGENLIHSPFSIGRAFAGYHTGDHLPEAFEAVFGFTADTEIDHWLKLTEQVTDRSDSENPEESRSNFTSSDIYWVDSGRVSAGSADWGAFDLVHALPIEADPEGSIEEVNAWIEKKSHGMLKNFLSPTAFDGAYAAATNVVFFQGFWPEDFKAKELPFNGASGSKTVPGFVGGGQMRASVSDDLTVLRLRYSDDYDHWIVMPHDDLGAFAENLDGALYNELKDAATSQNVAFHVPEFSMKSDPDLDAAIGAIRDETGTAGGTFTGAHIETILHKAAIEFTREGTKAAAATVIIEHDNNSPEPEPVLEVNIDRPFLHVIEDARNGSILFMGEVADPE